MSWSIQYEYSYPHIGIWYHLTDLHSMDLSHTGRRWAHALAQRESQMGWSLRQASRTASGRPAWIHQGKTTSRMICL
jgi:hypothetical protein